MNTEGPQPDRGQRSVRPGVWWWLRQLLLVGISAFFLFFGISLLIAVYALQDPFSFVMAFFGACLILMISAVMLLGFVMRMIRTWRAGRRGNAGDD